MARKRKERDLFEWAENVHSVWITLGNAKAAEKGEGIPIRQSPFPHYNAPVSLNEDESPLVLPALARQVTIGVELACRISGRGERVAKEEADALVESFHVFVAVRDNAHYEYALQRSKFPHFGKEDDPTWDIDYEVVQSWADGFHILSKAERPAREGFPEDAEMRLEVTGRRPVRTNTREYVHRFAAVIENITRFVCVDKGDVISLGRAGALVTLPPGKNLPKDAKLSAAIEGVGEMTIPIVDLRSDDNYYTRAQEGASAGAFV